MVYRQKLTVRCTKIDKQFETCLSQITFNIATTLWCTVCRPCLQLLTIELYLLADVVSYLEHVSLI